MEMIAYTFPLEEKGAADNQHPATPTVYWQTLEKRAKFQRAVAQIDLVEWTLGQDYGQRS